MTIKDLYSTSRPSLDLNFALTKRLDPRVTFSRASSGTYFDANGVLQSAATNVARFDHNPSTGESLGLLVEESRTNGFQYSTLFSRSYWNSNANVTVVPNAAAAPDGTFTAQLIIPASGTVNAKISRNSAGSSGTNRVYTFYVKSNGVRYITINTSSANYGSCFDLQTGSLLEPLNGFVASPRIEALPNGWWRISHVTSTGAVPALIAGTSFSRMGLSDTATFDGVSGFYLWGAQWEDSTTFHTSYIPTPATFTSRASTATYYDASGVIQTAGIDVARSAAYFPDSNGVMKPAGLLLEAAGTNLVTYSQEFDNAAWTKSYTTVTANATTAPDGTATADKLIATVDNTQHTAYQTVAVSGTYTASCFFKASEYTQAVIAAYNATDGAKDALFDLFTGTVVTSRNATAQIAKHPNGWYRCSVTASFTTSTTFDFRCRPNTASQSDPRGSYSGDGVSGGFVWGAQLEAGSYPTSYIPTTSSTVTRSADVSSSATVTRSADVAQITGTNFSSWYRQDEGTIYCRNQSAKNSGNGYGAYVISDNTASNRLLHAANLSGTASDLIVVNGGVEQVNFRPLGSTSAGAFYATSFAYKANSFAGSGNGGATVTDAAGSVPSVNRLDLGFFYPGSASSNTLNGTISRLAYYPTRLTDAQLQALTAS